MEGKREAYKKDAERLLFPRRVPTGKGTTVFIWKKVECGETPDWVAQRSCRLVSGI